MTVTAPDIDGFGHVNNVVWVRWVNEVSYWHSCAVGLDPEACNALDAVWVVRSHAIEYLRPAFEGQSLECFTWPEQVQGATSLRRTVFLHEGRELVRAETTWALLSVSTGRPRRVPVEMMRAYGFTRSKPA